MAGPVPAIRVFAGNLPHFSTAICGGYPDLIAALKKITTPENVRKVVGENWMRVLGQAKAA